MAAPGWAQTFQQRARITGGGGGDSGRCTMEVVVDGAAEVDIRGADAGIRDLSGRQPQWRRFECTSVMPPNPVNFRFRGIDGRGRVSLLREPRNGAPAVVRIVDPQGGAEAYTFEVMWGGGGYGGYGRGWDERDRWDQRRGGRWTTEQAIQGCRDAVSRQVADRYRTRDVFFRDVRLDDNPGRRDWVIGRVDVRRWGRDEHYRFSCSVNFDNGVIRSADVQPIGGYGERYR